MSTTSSSLVRRAGVGPMVFAAAVVLAVAGCSSSGSKAVSAGASTTAPASASTATVLARSTKLGTVLTDASGRTLYTFDQDTAGATASACTGACASAWPPLTATGTPTAGAGVQGALATISGGQVTRDGHPLYRWMGDHAAGDTTGDGINGFHVAMASAASPTPASSTTSGNGY
jgi:predicted lipoprotein with Yx(FWY)xxD motif